MPGPSVQIVGCAKCGALLPSQQTRGRRRKFCLECGPRKRPLPEVQLGLPSPCVTDGCDEAPHARGLCRKHYAQHWLEQNRDRVNAYNRVYLRTWRLENPDRERATRRRTYEKHRVSHVARAVARNRGLRMASPETLDYRLVLQADPCAYCGEPATDVDHIDPVVRGASNEWPNLTAACRGCNAQKGPKSLLEFLCLKVIA